MPYSKSLVLLILLPLYTITQACKKDSSTPLVEDNLRTLDIQTGFTDNIVAIAGNTWQVTYVRYLDTEELLLDQNGKPMTLIGSEETQHADGWITLQKTADGQDLSISLQENLSPTPRSLEIGLVQNSQKDVIRITQHRGTSYKIVDQQFEEIPEVSKVYTSSQDCIPITVSNSTAYTTDHSTDDIFRNIKYTSQFTSDDPYAFVWNNSSPPTIAVPELQIEDASRWSGVVLYDDKLNTDDFVGEGKTTQSIQVKPYTNIDLEGSVTYAERTVAYTFIIQNEGSGNRFPVSGLWKQKVPISATTIIKKVY